MSLHQDYSQSIRSFNGTSPELATGVYIDKTAVVIGDVKIGEDSSIWPKAVVRGDMHKIEIGARTSIQDNCVCHITHAGPFNPTGWPLNIGSDCTIAHGVILHGCTIKDRVLIGMGSIVMDGAIIESDVVVGANSLVPPGKVLKSGFLYTGSPAREVRALSEKELQYFTYSANNYRKLKDQYLDDEKAIE